MLYVYNLRENYFQITGQYFLNFDLSWLIFTCHIIEYRAKFDKVTCHCDR